MTARQADTGAGTPSRWGRRTLAFLVDFAIVHLVLWLLFAQVAGEVAARHDVEYEVDYPYFDADSRYGESDDLDAADDDFERLSVLWYPIWIVLATAFYGLLEAWTASPGKWLFRLRVRRQDGARRVGAKAFARSLPKAFVGPIHLPMLFGWAIFFAPILAAFVLAHAVIALLPLILDIRNGAVGQRWIDGRLGLAVRQRDET